MARSKEYIEGFKDALKTYAWIGNDRLLRVGLPGIVLDVAIAKIERECESIEKIEPTIEKEEMTDVKVDIGEHYESNKG